MGGFKDDVGRRYRKDVYTKTSADQEAKLLTIRNKAATTLAYAENEKGSKQRAATTLAYAKSKESRIRDAWHSPGSFITLVTQKTPFSHIPGKTWNKGERG